MQKLIKIMAMVYIVCIAIFGITLPMSAIMLLVKLCGSSALSWVGSCFPLIISIAISPIFALAKATIDNGGKNK